MKTAFDQDALIELFSSATARQGEQLRQAVFQATLGALQGRELSLKNIREVLKTITKAASTGLAQNTGGIDAEELLDKAVAGMDDALFQAVEANRVALQRFVDQGVGLQEKTIKKAVSDLEKMEDTFIEVVKKAAEAANSQMAGQWGAVLDRLQAGGTNSGAQASTTAEQLVTQMQTAMRDTRAAGLKATQALAESYSALVSGVLIGMSDALQQGAGAGAGTAKAGGRRK